jgi:hypothetical protein
MNVSPAFRVAALILNVIAVSACGSRMDPKIEAKLAGYDAMMQELPRGFYEPGLGDLMHALQLRHAKLWFAGSAGNWQLAAFETHEIEETLERIARWHHDSEDIAMGAAIKVHMRPGLYALEQSIARREAAEFRDAFDRLTQGCNACHRASKHGFIVIQEPTQQPYSNQAWRPIDAGSLADDAE